MMRSWEQRKSEEQDFWHLLQSVGSMDWHKAKTKCHIYHNEEVDYRGSEELQNACTL